MVLKIKDRRGFTIIEMMTVVFIMGILSTFVVASYRDNEASRDLKFKADLLVDGLERAQSFALAGSMADNQIPLGYRFRINECSDDCKYLIVALLKSETDDPTESLMEERSIPEVDIDEDFSADFMLPRGQVDKINPISFIVSSDAGSYTVQVDPISGRINLIKINETP
jgi:prepilin-type N-terminal cleavage/methylation domain-containing protein